MPIIIGELFNRYETILHSKKLEVTNVEDDIESNFRTQPRICDICGNQTMLSVRIGKEWVCGACENMMRQGYWG